MLTAYPCQPMPGPMGAVWPSAKPGIDYCGPYPACCPPVAQSWWQHLIGLVSPHGDWSLIALDAFGAVLLVAFIVFVFWGNALQRRQEQSRMNRRDA